MVPGVLDGLRAFLQRHSALSPIVIRAFPHRHSRFPPSSFALSSNVIRAFLQRHSRFPPTSFCAFLQRHSALSSNVIRAFLQRHSRFPPTSFALSSNVIRAFLQRHSARSEAESQNPPYAVRLCMEGGGATGCMQQGALRNGLVAPVVAAVPPEIGYTAADGGPPVQWRAFSEAGDPVSWQMG